jgi:hypothetical protein
MAGPLPDPHAAAKGWFIVTMAGVAAWVATVTFFFLR